MKRLLTVCLLLAGVTLAAQDAKPPLPKDVQQQVTIYQLKIRLLDAERRAAQLATMLLQQQPDLAAALAPLAQDGLNERLAKIDVERESVEKLLKATLGGTDNDTIDWSTDPPTLKKATKPEG